MYVFDIVDRRLGWFQILPQTRNVLIVGIIFNDGLALFFIPLSAHFPISVGKMDHVIEQGFLRRVDFKNIDVLSAVEGGNCQVMVSLRHSF